MTSAPRSSPPELIRIARELFTEAYEGPKPEGSWFTNVDPEAGVFGSIRPLSAGQASRTVTPGGPSIAAHIEHLRWSLAAVNQTLRGGAWQPDWAESWSVQTVDEQQWQDLQAGLRREYSQLLEALQRDPEVTDAMMLRGLFALAPHAAHHLGAIRQLAKLVQA